MRYNTETDYLQVCLNDVWTDWKKTNIQSTILEIDSTIWGYAICRYQYSSASCTYNEDNITLSISKSSTVYSGIGIALQTLVPYDLTDYRLVRITYDATFVTNGSSYVTYSNNLTSSQNGSEFLNNIGTSIGFLESGVHNTLEINIAELTGKYYLKVCSQVTNSNNNGGTQTVKIYKFELK